MPLVTFSANSTARAADVNANFALCVLTDTARTIAVTHIYSASQTFTGGFTTGAAVTLGGDLKFTDATYDIGKSGATRPRDGFFSRNVTIGGTLTVTDTVTATTGVLSQGYFQLDQDEGYFTIKNTTGGTNEKYWRWAPGSGTEFTDKTYSLYTLTDIVGAGSTALRFTRSGTSITKTNLNQQANGSATLVLDNTAASSQGSGVAFLQSGTSRGFVGVKGVWQGDTSTHLVMAAYGNGGIEHYVNAESSSRFTIVGVAGTPANSSLGNFFILNSSAPTGNPTGGGFLYSESGALKWRGSSGTVTTMGPA